MRGVLWEWEWGSVYSWREPCRARRPQNIAKRKSEEQRYDYKGEKGKEEECHRERKGKRKRGREKEEGERRERKGEKKRGREKRETERAIKEERGRRRK